MTAETSPGNFQFWFFLKTAVDPALAQKLGELIRHAVNSDTDTGNPTQPYRVAGTVNYPNAKKIARGRVTVPTHLIACDPTALWTPEDIEQAFPAQPKTNGNSGAGASAGGSDEASIPADTMRIIRDGPSASASNRDRSQTFWNVMRVLKGLGFTVEGIVNLLERYPDGISKKYEGRLRQEVERAYNKLHHQGQSDEALLAELNRDNAVVLDGARTRVLRFEEMPHEAGGERYIYQLPTFLRFEDFRNFYLNRYIDVGDDRPWSIGKWWLGHPDRRQYRGVTFIPAGAPIVDGRLNLWCGWGVEPKRGDWPLLREHMFEVLAARDDDVDCYIYRVFADSCGCFYSKKCKKSLCG
jgi:hypothetical protein